MGKPQSSQNFWSNLCLGTLLALVTVVITLAYTGQEHSFHWWIDWYNRTLEVVEATEESPEAGWQIIVDSLGDDRNQLYTIPLVPFLLIFGKSREVYQIALALVYLFPFSLVMGSLAAQLVTRRKNKIFWLAALITLLTPVTWMSTFLGIPDTGAATFIGLATLLYFQTLELTAKNSDDPPDFFRLFTQGWLKESWRNLLGSSLVFIKEKRTINQTNIKWLWQFIYQCLSSIRQYWRIPVVGVAIAIAIMIRRHFAYGGIALMGSIGLLALVESALLIRKNWGLALWNLVTKGLQLFVIADTCLFTLKKIVPEFTNQAIATNYKNLYTSWSLPFSTIFWHYVELLGIIPWLLVVLGFTIAYNGGINPKTKLANHQQFNNKQVTLMVFSGIVSLGIWLFRLRYGNVFYFLHVIPLVVVGMTLFLAKISYRFNSRWRTFFVSAILSFLVANLVMGFTNTGNSYQQFRSLFALGIPPIVRQDYDEVTRLIKHLRAIAPHQEPIYVVGYQRLHLSPSLINSGEKLLYGNKNQMLNILNIPQADSQDYYPLEQLLQAEFVILPSNLGEYLGGFADFPANGEWLPPSEYDVVKIAFYAFIQSWLITQDFKEMPQQFQLQGDTTVKIYQRTRPTSLQNIIKTLAAMQAEIQELPGSQLPWISLSDWLNSSAIIPEVGSTFTLAAFPTNDSQPWTRSFLYLFPPSKTIKITGKVNFYNSFCQDLSFRFKLFNQQGELINSTNIKTFTRSSTWHFSLSNNLEKSYLVLETQSRIKNNKLAHSCGFWLNEVKISS